MFLIKKNYVLLQNKWNGLIAELLEDRADLTLTALKVTTERNLAIDFSVPLMETGIGLVVALRRGAISTTAFLSKRTNIEQSLENKLNFLCSRTI